MTIMMVNRGGASVPADVDDNEDTLGVALNYDADDLDNILKLQKSQRYINIMQQVDNSLYESELGCVIDDHELLILNSHSLLLDIEKEIVLIHNFIRDKYGLRSLELESLVHHPVDYARAVKNMDVSTLVDDLEGLLPSAIIMVFSCWRLGKTIEACDRSLALHSAKEKVMGFFESRMRYLAPNLSALVGFAVAAKLMNAAGGLSSLAKMPTCYVLIVGGKRKNSNRFSRLGGYIEQSEIVQSIPHSLRQKASILLSAKSISAARVDSSRSYLTGEYGTRLRERMLKMTTNGDIN